jgi:hypothetical protein
MNNEELSKTQAQVSSHQEMTEEQLDTVNAGDGWTVFIGVMAPAIIIPLLLVNAHIDSKEKRGRYSEGGAD